MITYAKYTSIGERSENEDSVMSVYDEKLGYGFIVADGLGGHGRGKEASSLCVDTFKEEFEAIVSKFSSEEKVEDNESKDTKSSNDAKLETKQETEPDSFFGES